jgi:COP9 signalosome complex subunit 4
MSFIAGAMGKFNNDEAMEIGNYAIDRISHRHLAFEDEVKFHVHPNIY